jgi:hypothetical protein
MVSTIVHRDCLIKGVSALHSSIIEKTPGPEPEPDAPKERTRANDVRKSRDQIRVRLASRTITERRPALAKSYISTRTVDKLAVCVPA